MRGSVKGRRVHAFVRCGVPGAASLMARPRDHRAEERQAEQYERHQGREAERDKEHLPL